MARLLIYFAAALTGLALIALLACEPAFAQGNPPDPGGGGRPGGGRPGGGRGGGRGGDRMREMMEEIQKEADKAAYDAARKATEAGKSEEEVKEAARKAADAVIDKRADEAIERMGQGRGGPGGGAPGGMGGFDPEQIKERMKERMGDTIREAADAAAGRAMEDFKTRSWKEIRPLPKLVLEERPEKEIQDEIKETSLFEDFQDTKDKDLKELRLNKPIVVFVYITSDGKKATERKMEKCDEMRENVFANEEFISACGEFTRLQVDFRDLNNPLKRKYRIVSSPTVVFFDCTGKRLWSFTSPKQKIKTLVKKMESYIEKSEEAKEKAREEAGENKDEEKEEPKEEPKEEAEEENKEKPGEEGGES